MKKIRVYIKRILLFFFVFYISFLLHTDVFGHLRLGMVVPNFMLVITSSFGFMAGPFYGMFMGFFSGLLMDTYQGGLFGLNCLVYLIIGYINGIFSKSFFGDDIRLPVLLIFLSDIFYGLFIYTFSFLTRGRYDIGFFAFNIIIPEAVYTVIIALIFYFPLLQITKVIKKSPTREKQLV